MWGNCVVNGVATLDCVPVLFQIGVNVAISLVGTVALILIIISGIRLITSQGGKQTEEAKNMLTYAIIGLVLVLFSFFILNLIAFLTGANCITTFGFSTCR